jgi:maleylpyruvate isomerase
VGSLTLYNYWRSSSSYRVRIALALKGIPYTYAGVDLTKGEQRTAAFREKSPLGYVPCLVHDGRALVESVAICEWLEETHPAPALLPRDPYARAEVRALCEIINASTQPFQNLWVLDRVSADKAPREAWAKHFIERGLAAFEAAMTRYGGVGTRGPYAYGAALTMADAFLVPQVYSARRFNVDIGAFPKVAAAAEAALADPRVAGAAPERQPDAAKV